MKRVRFMAVAGVLGIAGLGLAPWQANAVGLGTTGRGVATPLAPLNTSQMLVEFTCAAVSTGAYASTTVESCTLSANGSPVASAPAYSAPGNASATTATAAVPIGASLGLCWNVTGQPVIGPATNPPGQCTIVNTVVAA